MIQETSTDAEHTHRNIEVRFLGVEDEVYHLDPVTCTIEEEQDLPHPQLLVQVSCEECAVFYEFEWRDSEAYDMPGWARAALHLVLAKRGALRDEGST
jgi:hypothetical protein